MTTKPMLDILTQLAELQVQKGTVWIASKAFPENDHMQSKAAQYNNNLLGFVAYLDSGHRSQLAKWLATQM